MNFLISFTTVPNLVHANLSNTNTNCTILYSSLCLIIFFPLTVPILQNRFTILCSLTDHAHTMMNHMHINMLSPFMISSSSPTQLLHLFIAFNQMFRAKINTQNLWHKHQTSRSHVHCYYRYWFPVLISFILTLQYCRKLLLPPTIVQYLKFYFSIKLFYQSFYKFIKAIVY